MAASPVNPPSPDDLSGLTMLWQMGKEFIGPIFGAGGLGIAWQAGAKLKAFEAEQVQNKIDHLDHSDRIKALESARTATDIKIAELPTRIEIAAYFNRIEQRLDQFAYGRRQE